jgi:hypothetical protein
MNGLWVLALATTLAARKLTGLQPHENPAYFLQSLGPGMNDLWVVASATTLAAQKLTGLQPHEKEAFFF